MSEKFIPFAKPSIGQDEIEEVVDTLKSGWITTGPKTHKFEEMVREYVGAKNAAVVNSCTAALHLSLIAANVAGGEVITTPYTFVATANVIVHSGAKPVFADVQKDTFNIDPNEIEKKITEKTKAIVPVDYAGQPCDLDEIRKIAKRHGLRIIEDAAHAIGAEYGGKKLGTMSDSTCFSFYATKNMTTAEGGIATTNNDAIAERISMLRMHGMSKDAWKRYGNKGSWYYEVDYPGWKYNMTDIAAAIGMHQLRKLDSFIKRRREIAKRFSEEFERIDGLIVPTEKKGRTHIYHLYPLIVEGYDRAKFVGDMQKKGIGCSVHFIPVHFHPYYKRTYGYKKGSFPAAEWLYAREVSLPLYPSMSDEDVETVISAVKRIMRKG
ncbi:MAG: DegT/DnrJ/EryC1/StrS family aminotransferase [Candidatus Micrarchaeota archaeon]|nr:DegT/DnrJ/EryC1/StrS family aminotransferase [Candidatus Micrarchaeota archaeon]